MGSKKHKKHHKSDKRERIPEAATVERPAEPLRIVLKVGGSSASEHGDSPHVQPHPEIYLDDRTFRLPEKHKKAKKKKKKKSLDKEKKHKHHHHHHEKKEKRKRERDDITPDSGEMVDNEETAEQPPSKQPALYTDEETQPERSFREPRACTLKNRQGKTSLQHLLDYLLKSLERKDPQQFFAWPVTDNIAPGYSSIIAHPMDFSTMRTKMDNNEYSDIGEFKVDVKLMCDNAMTYNRPDTIYYKAAKKLLHVAFKITTKEKLVYLKNTMPFISDLGKDELGFEMDEQPPAEVQEGAITDENVLVKESKKKVMEVSQSEDDSDEGVSPEEILAQARRAAKMAADRLALRRPNSKFGFLRQRNDGSTSLAILNPGSNAEPGKEERKVTLDVLIGKLAQGTGSIAGFKEDKRNIVKPISYLKYGSFATYAPAYDSTFANLTKEESDLIYSTYGDETGVQYAESLLNFAKDSDFISELADSILDALTDGDHSRTSKIIEARKKRQECKPAKWNDDPKAAVNAKGNCSPALRLQPTTANSSFEFNFDSLRSLADEGIDISFLDNIERELKRDPIQKKLDETTSMIHNLANVQNARLSAKPPAHLSRVQGPSPEEVQLASKVSNSLVELSKKANPADLVNSAAIHKAMGITVEPSYKVTSVETEERIEGESGERSTEGPPSIVTREPSPTERSIDAAAAIVTEGEPSNDGGGGGEDFQQPPSQSAEDELSEIVPSHLSAEDPAADLEMELREFLETGPTLRVSDSPSQMDEALEDVIP